MLKDASSLRLPFAGVLMLAALWAFPRDASAAALTGLSTSLGLAGSLLAVLALQGGSPGHAAALLGTAMLLLLLLVAARRSRTVFARVLPRWLQHRAGRPMLARAVRSEGERQLLGMARTQFLELQSAWDRGDLDALRRLTTESMFDELAAQLPHRGAEPNRTDVLSVEAHLISHEAVGPLELASIEFSGMVRESAELGAMPFREVWMLARQQPESSWRLARQQALL
ncbi:Tim44-like domain-containing protein [Piscinibacter sp.]|uniref:Tim44 domain-containing protein n=1 Tax=Piscinibacter sp. TaxID=1903157 RepID=UPI001B3F24AB|nr:Tim44-like domain-containing protein [Piscinibacter sp.]MBK7532667.1 Tim44 domain-containing protein [Piscinibacter sp.]MBP6541468.1 Tim44 domain-containing protein [Piscinibacter sp.]HPG79790.1 Tim44-like domain-containing protein [Piscinibacter sp.]